MHRNGKHIRFSKELWSECSVEDTPMLSNDEVHVWKANLIISTSQRDLFWSFLSEDEQVKAKRFYFEKDRFNYIAGRGILRSLIAVYTQQNPNRIQFSYTEFGKPSLVNNTQLSFNVSHSSDTILLAFTQKNAIGVDIEKIDATIDFQTIVKRFFSKNEAQIVLNLPVEQRATAFYKCWTRKEAFIKGHGQGLGLPLDQFEVNILDENPVVLHTVQWAPVTVKDWCLYSFEPDKESMAALIIKAKKKKLAFFEWTVLNLDKRNNSLDRF